MKDLKTYRNYRQINSSMILEQIIILNNKL